MLPNAAHLTCSKSQEPRKIKLLNVSTAFASVPRAIAALIVAAAAAFSPPVCAQTSLHVRGDVRDRESGLPVRGARVVVTTAGGAPVASLSSDRDGAFVLAAQPAGVYRIRADARGYRAAVVTITFAGPSAPYLRFLLIREAPVGEIASIVARSSRETGAPPTQRVSDASLENEGSVRLSDALGKLAGIDVAGDALAPGGDAYLSLRGLRPGESQTMLDGHPIGPIGVEPGAPDADGTIAGFNFQDAPYFALRGVDVSFGSDASTFAGNESLAGSVDLRTLDPTERDELVVQQGFGSEGRALTSLRATGTGGRFGFALVHGVVGTYGLFSGAPIAQTGLRGTDFTSTTLAALTYRVSGDYVLRNDLAKITYALAPGTRVELAAYDATSWADKTGEGDNDFNPYAYVLANAPVGASVRCPHGVQVETDDGPACLSPQAYAGASGPAGGGPGAWQALRNQDVNLRFATVAGKSAYALDAFTDRYAFLYNRDASPVSGPLDAFLDRWSTQGVRLSDDLSGPRNAFGFGFAWLRQALAGDGTTLAGAGLAADAPVARLDRTAFVRDTFAPTQRLSVLAAARLTGSTGDARARLDPQLSLVWRPAARDAIRLGAGHATEEPSLETGRVDLLPAGALNPDCGAIARATKVTPADVNVGSGPAADLTAETASDVEFGFEHRFGSDATLGLRAYDMNVKNRIVSGDFPAGSQLPTQAIAPLLERIGEFCGLPPDPSAIAFTLGRAFNVATARVRGVELAGRAPLSRRVALDYSVDVQSSVLDDLPASALETDPTLVNGAQVFGVPLRKATLGIDALTRGGLEVRLDGHAVGPNNAQQLPGYAYADASLSQALSKHVTLLVAISNIFDSHAQSYGLVGEGLPYATNSFNTAAATPFDEPFNERYGLPPACVTVSATLSL